MTHQHRNESAAQAASPSPNASTYKPALDLAAEFLQDALEDASGVMISEGNEALFGATDETPGLMDEALTALEVATRAPADERPVLVAEAAGLLRAAIAVARQPVPEISTGRNRELRQSRAAFQRERWLLVARVANALLQVRQ